MPVVAAVCYRYRRQAIEVLLVKTSDGTRWTFPKGHVEEGESPPQAVAREAQEEAGVQGEVALRPLISYYYPPTRSSQGDAPEQVDAYLLRVTRLDPSGEQGRTPTWFRPNKARNALSQNREAFYVQEHSKVIDVALAHLGELLRQAS